MKLLLPPLALLVAAPAFAQDLEPSPLSALDPDQIAHLVVADEGTGATPRRFAIDGRFAGDINGDGLDDIVLPGAVDDTLHLVFGSASLDPSSQDRRDGAGDSVIVLPSGCRDGDDRVRWAAIGDINGDDRQDLGVACLSWSGLVESASYAGAAAIYLGRGSWPATVTEPDVLLLGDELVLHGEPLMPVAGTRPGADIAGIGDLDGDGRGEFIVTGFDVESPQRPTGWILSGSPLTTDYDSVSDATWAIQGEAGALCTAPLFAAGIGDIDGDTVPDLAVSCVVQPSEATVDIDLSVWLGGDLVGEAPGAIDFTTRSFRMNPSDNLAAYPSPLSRLGDLDGDGFDEFNVTSFVDGLSATSARLVAGHPGPWVDFGFLDTWWLENEGLIDPYAAWQPSGTYDSADGTAMALADDLSGDGFGDLWVRSGSGADAVVGLLSSPSPATWADGSVPPYLVTVGRPGAVVVDDDERFGLGGSGDANGDGARDLLITSGFGGGDCTVDVCGAAYLILCVDQDGDGVGVCEGDCDDGDDTVFPGGIEICDEVDHDCDGNDGSVDGDGDGVLVCDGDCDDGDPTRYPGAEETCDGTADLDCDGLAPADDRDADGALNCEDCQPFMAAMAPGNPEACDQLDTNCDGSAERDELDVDQDGVPACARDGAPGDCDDLNPLIRPGRFEDCFNGIDDNCDGAIDIDVDADGDGIATCDGDCDDTNADIFPGHTELCDGLDNNCNGVVDDARDDDGDGATVCDGDCDDRDPLRFPGNVGNCDPSSDADCSGTSDLQDADGDGFSACGGDCAEGDPGISPGVFDFCDGIDNDCDGVVDGPFDVDGDGWATCFGDCRDDAPLTHPQVVEPVCGDVQDGDCDGLIDSEDPDCAEEATPPPVEPRPYGLSCASSVAAGSGGWLALVVVLGVLGASRRRRRTRGAWLGLVLIASLAPPSSALAAKKEPALIVYLSARPDLAAMQEARLAAPKVDAAEILHSTELLPDAQGLTARGARRVLPCEGRPPDLGTATTAALDALIELNHREAIKVADKALAALPCVDREVPARLLPNLYYYRALAKAALRAADAEGDFAQVIALAPGHKADASFDPAANARLEAARKASEGKEVDVSAFVLPGGRLRIDGNDIEPTATSTALRPGLHVAQVRAGKVTSTVVFELVEDAGVVILRAQDRERALRDAPVSEGARAYARAELADAALTAEVDLVAVVDLDVEADALRYLFRPSSGAFSFEESWGSAATATAARGSSGRGSSGRRSTPEGGSLTVVSSGSGKSAKGGGKKTGGASAGGAGGSGVRSAPTASVSSADRGPGFRLRVSGGFALTRPFPYVQIPVDIGVRLVRGLHLDLQVAAANPGKLETGGPVWLPTAALGASYRFEVPVFEPRIGGAFQIGIDDSTGSIAPLPGWYGLVGFDVLVPGSPLLVGFDVRAGMLGRPFFLGVSAGVGVAL